MITRKQFREYLNKQYPVATCPHKNNQYGNTKRDYGDYLWHQDRGMFEANYSEYIANENSSS